MYGNYYPPYQAFSPIQTQRQELIRVNGMEGAKAYQMPANSVAALFDSNQDLLYVKSTDGAGFPSIRVFTFSEQAQNDSVATQGAEKIYDHIMKTLEEIKGMIGNGKQFIRPAKQPDKPAE